MILKSEYSTEVAKNPLEDWHPYFSLYPRIIHKKDGVTYRAFLQYIERKGRWSRIGEYDSGYIWQYRVPGLDFEPLAEDRVRFGDCSVWEEGFGIFIIAWLGLWAFVGLREIYLRFFL